MRKLTIQVMLKKGSEIHGNSFHIHRLNEAFEAMRCAEIQQIVIGPALIFVESNVLLQPDDDIDEEYEEVIKRLEDLYTVESHQQF